MNELHNVYLNLGSNIQPEVNLARAIQLLRRFGEVQKISTAWESKSVGAPGPNYLNACVLFQSSYTKVELKERVIDPIEARLGRKRSADKYIPRTIDIDVILFDDLLLNDKVWEVAYVIAPLAEIYSGYHHPITRERITEAAARLRQRDWIEPRPQKLSGNNSKV